MGIISLSASVEMKGASLSEIFDLHDKKGHHVDLIKIFRNEPEQWLETS